MCYSALDITLVTSIVFHKGCVVWEIWLHDTRARERDIVYNATDWGERCHRRRSQHVRSPPDSFLVVANDQRQTYYVQYRLSRYGSPTTLGQLLTKAARAKPLRDCPQQTPPTTTTSTFFLLTSSNIPPHHPSTTTTPPTPLRHTRLLSCPIQFNRQSPVPMSSSTLFRIASRTSPVGFFRASYSARSRVVAPIFASAAAPAIVAFGGVHSFSSSSKCSSAAMGHEEETFEEFSAR